MPPEISMTSLTIFSAPKPFTNPHIDIIQRNAIRSWVEMDSRVEVILVGDEQGMGEAAAELGVRHLPGVATNPQGTPLVSSIFELARQHSTSKVLAYVNADILLLPDFMLVASQLARIADRFLAVGRRWDLDVRQPVEFSLGWETRLKEQLQAQGRLHAASGSDYFIFPRECFAVVPPFAIGRAGWDNWMIYEARRQGWPVVEASSALTVIHQDHDYGHLPGGQPHYRLPETAVNVRLAGGRRALFSLQDANYVLSSGELRPIPKKGRKLLRELETFPIVSLNSKALAELTFAIFHPLKAWGEWRGRLGYKLHQLNPGKKS
jgi:hypothetical protein